MVLGLAMLAGGWTRKELMFNRLAAETAGSMMLLSVVALVIPAIYASITQHRSPEHIESLSLDISFVLIATYAASLLFQFRTHRRLFGPSPERQQTMSRAGGRPEAQWTPARSVLTLIGRHR